MEFSISWIIAFMKWCTLPSTKLPLWQYWGSSFIKLMFTVWISIHLFALAVFHKNLQRLERLYWVSSLLIPLAVTIVLLGINLTGCHGYRTCTYLREEIIFIIIFTVLVIVSLLMIIMGTIPVIEHVEGGIPFFLNMTNSTRKRYVLFSCTNILSSVCNTNIFLCCMRFWNTSI